MTAVAVIGVLMAVTGWVLVRRVTDEPPTDLAEFLLTIPADEWRKP